MQICRRCLSVLSNGCTTCEEGKCSFYVLQKNSGDFPLNFLYAWRSFNLHSHMKSSLEFRQTFVVEAYKTSRPKWTEEQLADKHCKCSDTYLSLFGLEIGFGNLERACSHDKMPRKAQTPTSQEQHMFSPPFKGLKPCAEQRWWKMCLASKYYS